MRAHHPPSCNLPEAGSRHHMATAFLLADSVNHGIKLQENPTLQYLFYLAQIGLATCPISNHALFMELDKSPIGGCAQPLYAAHDDDVTECFEACG